MRELDALQHVCQSYRPSAHHTDACKRFLQPILKRNKMTTAEINWNVNRQIWRLSYLHQNPASVGAINSDVEEDSGVSHVHRRAGNSVLMGKRTSDERRTLCASLRPYLWRSVRRWRKRCRRPITATASCGAPGRTNRRGDGAGSHATRCRFGMCLHDNLRDGFWVSFKHLFIVWERCRPEVQHHEVKTSLEKHWCCSQTSDIWSLDR